MGRNTVLGKASLFILAIFVLISSIPHRAYAEDVFDYAGNYCLNFDGVDDYVSCGSPDTYAYRTAKMAFEFWMKPKYTIEAGSDVQYGRTIGAVVCYTESWTGHGWALYFDFSDGHLNFRYKLQGYGSATVSSTRDFWDANTWYHVAVVCDPSSPNELLVIYVNATVDRIQTIQYGILYENSNLKIGGHPAHDYIFGGLIDEFRYWGNYRTHSEILETWDRTLNEAECAQPELLGYWRFDEGLGGISEDNSNEGNNATLGLTPYNPSWESPGAPIIPELPSLLSLPLFMMAALVVAVTYKRKRFA